MTSYIQGTYHPINRQKYIGINDPQYRSSWEYSAFIKMDNNSRVLRWGSEIVVLPYLFEMDGKKHRYYVDIYAEMLDYENKVNKFLIEIKPDEKLFIPNPPKNKTAKALRNYKLRMIEYQKNINKWQFASSFAHSNKMEFLLMTEKGVYILNGNDLIKVLDERRF